jgi:hypothetical protein
MASVEEIYRKIRRGDVAGLKYSRPSDHDLALGVERIRKRIEAGPRAEFPELVGTTAEEARKRKSTRFKLLWLTPLPIAALVLFGIFYWPKTSKPPQFTVSAAGATYTFGSVRIFILNDSTLEKTFSDGKLALYLKSGAIAVKRSSAETPLTVSTPSGTLTTEGTAFVIEHNKETSIALTEGKLIWQSGGQTQRIDMRSRFVGRDLSDLKKRLPKEYSPAPQTTPDRRPHGFSKGEFAKNACVIYTLNGTRKQGRIKEVVHGKYQIAHEGIDEPDLFSGSALIGCGG